MSRISKPLAKTVQHRPSWVINDNWWRLFVEYRDTDKFTEDLNTLYGPSRVRQIISGIIVRHQNYGLSTRAVNVLRNVGVDIGSQPLAPSLKTLVEVAVAFYKLRNDQASSEEKCLARYLRESRFCGQKTVKEIVSFVVPTLDQDSLAA